MTKEKAKEWLYEIVKYPTEDTIIELVSELEEQNTNLQEMLKVERSVTCKEEYLKRVTELEAQIEKMKEELHHRLVSPSHDDSDCLDKIVGLDRLWQFGQEF